MWYTTCLGVIKKPTCQRKEISSGRDKFCILAKRRRGFMCLPYMVLNRTSPSRHPADKMKWSPQCCVVCSNFQWLLMKLESVLIAVTYTAIVADHLHPFTHVMFPGGDYLFQKDNATFLSHINHIKLLPETQLTYVCCTDSYTYQI